MSKVDTLISRAFLVATSVMTLRFRSLHLETSSTYGNFHQGKAFFQRLARLVSSAPFAILNITLYTPTGVASLKNGRDVLLCLVVISEPFVNAFGLSRLCEEIYWPEISLCQDLTRVVPVLKLGKFDIIQNY